MAPTEDYQDGRTVLWINTASREYKRLAARWKARAARLHPRTHSTPLTRRAHAHGDGEVLNTDAPFTEPGGLLLTTYPAAQGPEGYMDALSGLQQGIQNNAQNVLAAFDALIAEIEGVLWSIDKAGANALGERNYARAGAAIEFARCSILLREKISALKNEWQDIEGALSRGAGQAQQTPQAIAAQRRTGVQAVAFFRPILQALSDLGGSAKRRDVLGVLEQSMRDSSEVGQVRGLNSAQWAHDVMVKEGLLRSKSPFGIWEITEKGRAWLKQ